MAGYASKHGHKIDRLSRLAHAGLSLLKSGNTFCSLPEVTSDVISGITIDNAGVDVHVKFSYSRSNRS